MVLPNKNYAWKNLKESLGVIKNDGIFFSNDHLGVTEVVVNDISISFI